MIIFYLNIELINYYWNYF